MTLRLPSVSVVLNFSGATTVFDTMPDVSHLETEEELITYFYEYLARVRVQFDNVENDLIHDILSMNRNHKGLRFVYVDDILEFMYRRNNA